MDNKLTLPCDVAKVSDGYHTFADLYEHRHLLFINLVKQHKEIAFKTWKNDVGEIWDGWFILGLNTPHGQITYHLPAELWDLANVSEINQNEGYDGHNSADVLERLRALADI